jgi:hypothetical protein
VRVPEKSRLPYDRKNETYILKKHTSSSLHQNVRLGSASDHLKLHKHPANNLEMANASLSALFSGAKGKIGNLVIARSPYRQTYKTFLDLNRQHTALSPSPPAPYMQRSCSDNAPTHPKETAYHSRN